MEKNIVEKIIKEKIPCYFISPHFDDAVLSAGGLISHLVNSGVPVTVATVFTKGGAPNTFSAKTFLRLSGFNGDAAGLFRARAEEDINAFSLLGIIPVHLGFVDALWRKIPSPNLFRRIFAGFFPEFIHVYPIFRFLITSNKVSSQDKTLRDEIGDALSRLTGMTNKFFVFCPLGLNSHVDHILTREACLAAFSGRTILWSDFPYNIRNAAGADEIAKIGTPIFEWKENFEEKNKMIERYKSQYFGLFGNSKVPKVSEIYYEPV